MSKNILVVTGGALGDVLFHAGFIKALHQVSGQKIVLAAKKQREIANLFANIDYVDSVIPLAANQDLSGKISLPHVIKAFRAANASEIWIFHHSSSLALAGFLAGIKKRYGYYEPGMMTRWLFSRSIRVEKDTPPPFFFHRAKALMDHCDLDCDLDNVQFRQPDFVVSRIRAHFGLDDDERLIAIGLNTSSHTRQWGGGNYRDLAAKLAERYPGKFLLFGAGDVADQAQVIKDCPVLEGRIIDLTTAGLGLSESHALLQGADLYIGNDSFGYNLAAMSSIPTIGILRSGYPFAYNNWMTMVVSPTDHAGDVPFNQVVQTVDQTMEHHQILT